MNRFQRSFRRRVARAAAATLFLAALPAAAPAQAVQELSATEVEARIRAEGLERSRIPELAGHLTDVIGPRLTNSPGMRRAEAWTSRTLSGWGLANVRVEPWGEFGRGWENVSMSLRALDPYPQPLDAWPEAWSGSTDGPVRGPVVVIRATRPAELERYRGRLEGAFVMAYPPDEIGPVWEPRELRHPMDWLLETPEERERRSAAARARRAERTETWRARYQLEQALVQLMAMEGAAALLTPSAWTYDVVLMEGTRAYRKDQPIPGPRIVVAHEDYGQVWRNVERGIPVELELDVRNRWHEEDLLGRNVLADIPGTDLADEYVMIGAHLDSWHGGTGATDNAAGSVVMMEAMRILQELGVQPRRTIRLALWSGEEQGLFGSRAWVANHPELHGRISAYLNLDNGTGRIRGVYNQLNGAVTPIFREILAPFRDLGVVTVKHDRTGATDHVAFEAAGIPGFQFIQDPIEYSYRTHHSDIDTYERLVIDDLKQAAVVVAYTAYQLANRDELLPRPPAPGSGGPRSSP